MNIEKRGASPSPFFGRVGPQSGAIRLFFTDGQRIHITTDVTVLPATRSRSGDSARLQDSVLVQLADGVLADAELLSNLFDVEQVRLHVHVNLDAIATSAAFRYSLEEKVGDRQLALPYENVREFGVRPYRRVISVQAIYRREVFAP